MYIGAIDIGGSKTIAGLVNENGELLIEKQIVTEKSDCAAHFNRCAALLLEAAAEYGVPAQALEGVGVSLPGMVDHSHSVLLLAPGAGWRDFPAAEFLREALGIPRALVRKRRQQLCPRRTPVRRRARKLPLDHRQHRDRRRGCRGRGGCCWAATASPGSSGTVRSSSSTPSPVPAAAAAASRRTPRVPPSPAGSPACWRRTPRPPPSRGNGARPPTRRLRRARAGRVFARAGALRPGGGYLGQALAPVVSMLNPERVYFGGRRRPLARPAASADAVGARRARRRVLRGR